MKTSFKSATLFAGVLFGLASCTEYDMVDNVVRVGQMAPTVYWELPSNSVAAGEDVEFKAQYYTNEEGVVADHLEVWYLINNNVNTSVSCPLVSSTLAFTMATNVTNVTRDNEKVATYLHNPNSWDNTKRAYQLDTTFSTSKTLAAISWATPETWDQEKFDTYFPATLPQTFKDSLYKKCNYAEFRSILIKLNLMTPERFEGIKDSVKNPNTGGFDYFIKTDSMPIVKGMYDNTKFSDLILDPSSGTYNIEYSKIYTLTATLKAIDSKGIAGITDKKEIELR
ncbi:MAG: hypothetical protein PHH23_04355 [Paludibacteraceae bacterium]|nr:hypothetical protein [Paludibacteraceae bacterium]